MSDKAATLLEDLLSFADACESGDWGHLDEDATRLRSHAARLAKELDARKTVAIRINSPIPEGTTK